MIIFDLDGTLADCEHRRHFVDPEKNLNYMSKAPLFGHEDKRSRFIPDWQAFYEACDQDKPIEPVLDIFRQLNDDEYNSSEIEIWSGRCESVRDKTIAWLKKHCSFGSMNCRVLKMRPIGDTTPDDVLKEKWLDERIDDMGNQIISDIEYVFDDRPKVIRMWRRRGIFVFDVNQTGKEF